MTMSCPIDNISKCIYIGNTASVDEQSLFNYCAQYGPILSSSIGPCPWEKRFFCDFRIVQYMNDEHVKNFLLTPYHRIAHTNLEVKHYADLLKNVDLLNIDRKLFVGPIGQNQSINNIVHFYRTIDANVHCCVSTQYQQTYLLLEFSNRQHIRTVLEQRIIPKSSDHRSLTIHPAVNPIELTRKKTSSHNRPCQIVIRGLTGRINERMLTEYFEKRASVIACHISPIDRTCALMELANEHYVNQLLRLASIRLNGTELSLLKASASSVPLSSLFPTENHPYNDDEIDHLLEATGASAITTHSAPPILAASPVNSAVVASIPEITECGWTSPPRSMTHHRSSTDRSAAYLPSQPSLTTAEIDDLPPSLSSNGNGNVDVKPTIQPQKKISEFFDEFLAELDQIRDEYRSKFAANQRMIEKEIGHLITNERDAMKKFDRYLYDHRRSSKDSNKRRHSHLSPSNH